MFNYDGLLNRKFVHGKTDCYSLARDFYKQNFDLELTDYARPDLWWNNGMNLYMDHFYEEGFRTVDVPPRDWKPADALLIAVRSNVANHVAIVVEDGKILHHLWGRLSCIEPIRPYIRNSLLAVVRHKDIDIKIPQQEVDLMSLVPEHIRKRMKDAAAS